MFKSFSLNLADGESYYPVESRQLYDFNIGEWVAVPLKQPDDYLYFVVLEGRVFVLLGELAKAIYHSQFKNHISKDLDSGKETIIKVPIVRSVLNLEEVSKRLEKNADWIGINNESDCWKDKALYVKDLAKNFPSIFDEIEHLLEEVKTHLDYWASTFTFLR